ncbi:MAG: lysophospholipid acyltransferase family protein [Chloroflexota bacterium]
MQNEVTPVDGLDTGDALPPDEGSFANETDAPVDEQANGQPGNVELREQLIIELEALVTRLRQMTPEFSPPPYSPKRLKALMDENLPLLSPGMGLRLLERLSNAIRKDLLDPEVWKGAWYLLTYLIEYQSNMFRRRLAGEYETDEWGFDPEFLQVVEPFLTFMYKTYWRVQTSGMENIAGQGRVLLVCNHSGQLPWDGAMLGTAIYNEHPERRLLRNLYATWLQTLPFVSATLVRLGQALANEDNGIRLLEQEQLVSVFPEGYKGVGKLFKERYRLARFGRGGFVRMALKTGAPMLPVAIVGAEETYISLAKSDTIARMIGFPYFPISITWPWLGLLGFVPLPTKWFIDIGTPIPTAHYGPEAADNQLLVSQLTDQVRNIVQTMIFDRLTQRRSVFFG